MTANEIREWRNRSIKELKDDAAAFDAGLSGADWKDVAAFTYLAISRLASGVYSVGAEIAAQLAEHNEREAKNDAQQGARMREMLGDYKSLVRSLSGSGPGEHVAFFIAINGDLTPAACDRDTPIGTMVKSLAEKSGHRDVTAATWTLTDDKGAEIDWSAPAATILENACVNAVPRGGSKAV